MTFKLLDRVRMSLLSAPGTGPCALNLAAVGFQAFNVDLADGDSTRYLLEDGNPLGSVWEYGIGTYHSNGTLTRDTVTRSSLGGTTKINATSACVINAVLAAEDIGAFPLESLTDVTITSPAAGQLLQWNGAAWANANAAGVSAPSVVQSTSYIGTSSGQKTATFGSAVTAGNLLVMVGFGGSFLDGTAEGLYDRQQSWLLSSQYTLGYSMRTVRSGDGTTYNVGLGDPGGTIPLAAILFEIANADPTRLSEFLMSQGNAGVSGTHSLNVLAKPNSLILGFVGGDTGTLATPTPLVNLSGSGVVLAGGAASAAHNFGGMTFTWGGGAATNALVMALPGV